MHFFCTKIRKILTNGKYFSYLIWQYVNIIRFIVNRIYSKYIKINVEYT